MKTPIIIGGQKIGRLKASFLLFKEAWRFLKADKELLLVPVVSLVLSFVLFGIVTTAAVLFTGSPESLFNTNSGVAYGQYAYLFALYVISAFCLAIAQAVIVHIVYVRAHGGNATLGQGLVRAFSIWLPLLLWSLITGTVGIILRTISDRSEIIGKLVAGLLGAAWAVLTFFVVPVILLEKKSPVAAVATSTKLFKQTWGETLVSNVTLGLVFMLAHLTVLASFIGLMIYGASTQNAFILIAAIIGVVLWLVVAILVQSALEGILKTLLYIYAAENVVPENFNRELLESMLVRKGTAQPIVSPVTPLPNTSA